MSFERDTRTARLNGRLWTQSVADQGRPGSRRDNDRRLVLCFYPSKWVQEETTFEAWFEQDQAVYVWQQPANRPRREPTGTPKFETYTAQCANSHRVITVKTGMEAVVVQALGHAAITGDSADSAIYNLYWEYFIKDEAGLSYLCRFSPPDGLGHRMARERLNAYVDLRGRHSDLEREEINYEVIKAIETVCHAAHGHVCYLGQQVANQLKLADDLHAAIEAVLLSTDTEEVKHKHILTMTLNAATPRHHVIAAIMTTTYQKHPLLGLRACQRVETDPEFHRLMEATAATAEASRTKAAFTKCVYQVLRQAFKGVKL